MELISLESESFLSEDEISDDEFEKMNIASARKRTIAAETFDENEEFEHTVIEKDESVKTQLNEYLNKIFMFKNLQPEQKVMVIEAMDKKTISSNEIVIQEGDEGNELYVVYSGNLM